ncbi:hypothetical protein [Paenibacillus sp. MER 78]|uniref:hypothetical protein n=1 Tax=Paenibacillus sp. MER 78 TaxID=2939571 RepID=UPI00203E1699|nr:hypothetical protein [Paenibacillus sp. MER 78]MCM3128136.1 hypothetical protein [Paenibacillus sp. MER 78]
MTKAIQKFMDHYFDQLKAEYFKMLREIHDLDLVDQINDVIFTARPTKSDLTLMLNLIHEKHREQMKRNREDSQTPSEDVKSNDERINGIESKPSIRHLPPWLVYLFKQTLDVKMKTARY